MNSSSAKPASSPKPPPKMSLWQFVKPPAKQGFQAYAYIKRPGQPKAALYKPIKQITSTHTTSQTSALAFNPDQDKQLLAVKAQGKNMKEIGNAIGKSPTACANRHRQLAGPPTNATTKTGGGGPARLQNQIVQDYSHQNQQNQNQNQQYQKGKAGGTTVELQPDKDFTVKDLEVLCSIYVQTKNDFWLDIASKFYDKTGKRYSGETIAAKFAAVGDARAGK